jgi:hypothetical protein
MAEGRNVCRWIDLVVSVPVSMVTVACLTGQTDRSAIVAVAILATMAILLWALADEWVWLLWATQRVSGVATVIPRPTRLQRLQPNILGWIPFVAAWGLVWTRHAQMHSGALAQPLLYTPPPRTTAIVVLACVAQTLIVIVQSVRHALTPTAQRSVLGECASTVANVAFKIAIGMGTLAVAQSH